MDSLKAIGMLAASKGYFAVGIRVVRLVVSREPPELSVRYVADWEAAAMRSKRMFPVSISWVLESLYRDGVGKGLARAGSVYEEEAATAAGISLAKRLFDPTTPSHAPLRGLQLSFDMVAQVMRDASPSNADASSVALAFSRLKRMADGWLRRRARGCLELAECIRLLSPVGIPQLHALCVQIEYHDSEELKIFWLVGLMHYLMGELKYDAAVYLFSEYFLPSIMTTEITNVAQSFQGRLPATPSPPERMHPDIATERMVMQCLVKRCRTHGELEELLARFRALTLNDPTASTIQRCNVIVFIEEFRERELTDRLAELLHEFGDALPYSQSDWPALMLAYAATANIPMVLDVLDSLRRVEWDVLGSCDAALAVFEKAECVDGVQAMQAYRATKADAPAEEVLQGLELLEMFDPSGERRTKPASATALARFCQVWEAQVQGDDVPDEAGVNTTMQTPD